MSTSTKLLIESWVKTYLAAVSTAFAGLAVNPLDFTTKQIYSILFGAAAATLATIYSYFNKKDPRFGRTVSFVAKAAVLASKEANLSAPIASDVAAVGGYLDHLASENGSTAPITPGA